MKKQILLGILLACTINFFGTSCLAITDQEKQTLITQLSQQLTQLQQQLVQASASSQSNASWCYAFNVNLGTSNSTNSDVVNLHLALSKQGISYSPDAIGQYGSGTVKAVMFFQSKYQISPQSGYTGILTRTKLNTLYKCTASEPTSSVCTPNWQCGAFATCANGQQSRYCYDSHNCNNPTGKPVTAQICTKPVCSVNSDCGYSGPTGSPFCQAGNVYQIYTNWTCGNAGTAFSSCSSDRVAKLNTTCLLNQSCINGSCKLYSCTPSWSCSGFGACIDGVQTQTCYDRNNCGDAMGKPSQAQSCNSGNSSSGSGTCAPSWQCGAWGFCLNSQQTRYCYDSHNCNDITSKPVVTQSCTCAPNWQCGAFGSCSSGQQTRYCYDSNNCQTTTGKPAATQSCGG